MHSQMKIARHGEEITMEARNGGVALAWLMALEIALLGALLGHLATVLPSQEILLLPALGSIMLVAWTLAQIKPDYRIKINVAQRHGEIVRISPITGARVAASFPISDVESLSLLQTADRGVGKVAQKEYVVAIELRDGARHVLSARGPLLAYREAVSRFSAGAGIGSRVVRRSAG